MKKSRKDLPLNLLVSVHWTSVFSYSKLIWCPSLSISLRYVDRYRWDLNDAYLDRSQWKNSLYAFDASVKWSGDRHSNLHEWEIWRRDRDLRPCRQLHRNHRLHRTAFDWNTRSLEWAQIAQWTVFTVFPRRTLNEMATVEDGLKHLLRRWEDPTVVILFRHVLEIFIDTEKVRNKELFRRILHNSKAEVMDRSLKKHVVIVLEYSRAQSNRCHTNPRYILGRIWTVLYSFECRCFVLD